MKKAVHKHCFHNIALCICMTRSSLSLLTSHPKTKKNMQAVCKKQVDSSIFLKGQVLTSLVISVIIQGHGKFAAQYHPHSFSEVPESN